MRITLEKSAALVRQSFRNTDAEKRPRGGLEVLSGRFSLGPFPGLKAWAILCSPFGRLERGQENVQTAERRSNLTFSTRKLICELFRE